jgi:hypothetical protein
VFAVGKRYSIALHDLRISMTDAVEMLRRVENFFHRPFTVHLVCDSPLSENRELEAFIGEHTGSSSLEIVYHGVNHKCERKGWRMLAWYHNYEAEYIIDSDELRVKTAQGFSMLEAMLGEKPGICPPCWLASKKNILFLDSLHPLYREEFLHLVRGSTRFFSSVVSLGSPRKDNLFLLKPIAICVRLVAMLAHISRVRIAVHICDLDLKGSMELFRKSMESLEAHGYKNVLQRELAE